MKIASFEPWSYVDLLHRDLTRNAPQSGRDAWVPAVDILEDKDAFVLRADTPGVNPEDIEIAMEADVLTVAGVRHAVPADDGVEIQRAERRNGRFERRFTLPESVDVEHIKAKSRNGVLEISIPKLPVVEPRRITVEAA